MDQSTDEHSDAVDRVLEAVAAQPARQRRTVIALAGPPAAGKSTLATAIEQQLNGTAIVLGLDAFHFDDTILNARGDRLRKGAPHTFDVDGYRSMLERLRATPRSPVALPQFDRSLELTRSSAALAEPDHDVVITEGNWLLLDDDPWRSLRDLFDLTVMIDAEIETIRRRIVARWVSYGFHLTEAERRARENDLPNAELAYAQSATADLTVSTTDL